MRAFTVGVALKFRDRCPTKSALKTKRTDFRPWFMLFGEQAQDYMVGRDRAKVTQENKGPSKL